MGKFGMNIQLAIRNAVIFLTYYSTFEVLITKYVFKNMSIFKYLPEGIIYVLLIVQLISLRKKIKAPRHDILLLVLFVYTFLSATIVNKHDIFLYFLSVRTLFRYMILYLILVNLEITPAIARTMIKHIKICGIIAIAIGLLQILLPSVINEIIQPGQFQVGELSRQDSSVVKDGKVIFSLFERYDRFGLFLAIYITLLLCLLKSAHDFFIIILSSICIVFTYSRQAWLALLLSIFICLLLKKQYKVIYFMLCVMAAFALYIVASGYTPEDIYYGSPIQRVLQVFNPTYMEVNLKYARMRVFVDILPGFLKALNIYTFFGLGIGTFGWTIANIMTDNALLLRYFSIFSVEYSDKIFITDVYWIQLIMEIGIVGVLLFVIYFVSSFIYYVRNQHKALDDYSKSLNALSASLVVLYCIANFFGPNMLISYFAFYYWLILGITSSVNINTSIAKI